MRRRRGAPTTPVLLFLLAASAARLSAQAALGDHGSAATRPASVVAAPEIHPEAWPFSVGERLEYDLYLRGFRAGRCVLEVEALERVRGVSVYRVSLSVEAAALFLRIDDRKVSWIAAEPFRSLGFAETNGDGGEIRKLVELDHAARVFHERRPSDAGSEEGSEAPGRRTSGPMPEAAVDELAFLYLLRVLPLEPGTSLEMDRHFDPSRNPLRVSVAGRRRVETPGGEFGVLALRPVLPDSYAFSEEARAEVLLSDDDRRIVVQMRSRTRLGPVTARLRRYLTGS